MINLLYYCKKKEKVEKKIQLNSNEMYEKNSKKNSNEMYEKI